MLQYNALLIESYARSLIKSEKWNFSIYLIEFINIWVETAFILVRTLLYFNLIKNFNPFNSIPNLKFLSQYYLLNTWMGYTYTDQEMVCRNICGMSQILSISIFTIYISIHFLIHFLCMNLFKNSAIINANNELKIFLKFIAVNFIYIFEKIFASICYYIFLYPLFSDESFFSQILNFMFFVVSSYLYFYNNRFVYLVYKTSQKDFLFSDLFSRTFDFHLGIIKILVALNNNIFRIPALLNISIFINLVILFFIISNLVFILYEILVKKRLIIITNTKNNLFKLFFSIFATLFYILYGFFFTSNTFYISIIIFCSAISAWLITNVLEIKIVSFVRNAHTKPYFFIYLMDIFFSENFETFDHAYLLNETKDHFLEDNSSSLHRIVSSNSSNNKVKQNCLEYLKQVAHEVQENEKFLSKEEREILFFLKLVFKTQYNYFHKLTETLVNFEAKKYLKKENNKNSLIWSNINFIELHTFSCNEENLIGFKIIFDFDNCCGLLTQAMDLLEKIIFTVQLNLQQDLYPLIKESFKIKSEISKYMKKNITFNRNNEIYNSNLLFFLHKKLFNENFKLNARSLLNINDNINGICEIMTENYNNDRLMLIQYNMNGDSLIIKRGSQRFANFQGKNFEDIFPKRIKNLAKKIFLDSVSNNLVSFDFQIFVNDKNGIFLDNMKMKCKIYKSLNLEEIYILGKFETDTSDIIVFEYEKSSNELLSKVEKLESSYILNYSKQADEIFHFISLVPSIIPKVYYNEILEKPKHLNNKSKRDAFSLSIDDNHSLLEELEENEILIINKKKLYPHIYNLYEQFIFDDDYLKYELEKIKNISDTYPFKKIRIKYLYSIESDLHSEFYVYCFEVINSKLKYNKLLNVSIVAEQPFFENKALANINETVIDLNYSLSSSSVKHDKEESLNKGSHTNNNYSFSIKDTSQQMNKLSIFTFYVNIFIISFCVMFLIFGFIQDRRQKNIYKIKNSFESFRILFYQTAMNLFYNSVIYLEKSDSPGDDTYQYWKKLEKLNITVDFLNYANSELIIKIELLKEKLFAFKNSVSYFNFDEFFSTYIYLDTTLQLLYYDGTELLFKSINSTFLESFSIYINRCREAGKFTGQTYINIINYNLLNSESDLSNIWIKNISKIQRNVYEQSVNFPIYYKNLENVAYKLDNYFESEIENLDYINTLLDSLLIIFHFLLLIVCVIVIRFLIKKSKESSRYLKKLLTENHSSFLLNKISILKNITNFYSDHPVLNLKKLLKLDEARKKQIKDEIKKDENTIKLNDNSRLLNIQSEIDLKKLLTPIIKLISIIFFLYLVYTAISIFLTKLLSEKLKNITIYNKDMQNINYNLMSNVILLETLLFTNQSDTSFMKYFSKEILYLNETSSDNYGYIYTKIKNNIDLSKTILRDQASYYEISHLEKTINQNFECNFIYSQIQDTIFMNLKSNYPENILINDLTRFCYSYPSMSLNDYLQVIDFVNYSNLKILSMYNKSGGTYIKIKQINDLDEFYDQFTILLLILRPFQTYVNDFIINNHIALSQDNYLNSFLIYLSLNVVLEMIIFSIINRKFIKNVLTIEIEIKSLMMMLEC